MRQKTAGFIDFCGLYIIIRNRISEIRMIEARRVKSILSPMAGARERRKGPPPRHSGRRLTAEGPDLGRRSSGLSQSLAALWRAVADWTEGKKLFGRVMAAGHDPFLRLRGL